MTLGYGSGNVSMPLTVAFRTFRGEEQGTIRLTRLACRCKVPPALSDGHARYLDVVQVLFAHG